MRSTALPAPLAPSASLSRLRPRCLQTVQGNGEGNRGKEQPPPLGARVDVRLSPHSAGSQAPPPRPPGVICSTSLPCPPYAPPARVSGTGTWVSAIYKNSQRKPDTSNVVLLFSGFSITEGKFWSSEELRKCLLDKQRNQAWHGCLTAARAGPLRGHFLPEEVVGGISPD